MSKQFKVTLSREVTQSVDTIVMADNMRDAHFVAAHKLATAPDTFAWSPEPSVARPRVVKVEQA